jgi:hypothetical protein
VYAPSGLANSQAIACPSRASFAHLLFFAGFCSSQKWWSLSVKLRRLVCPSRSVQVVMSAKTAALRPTPLLSRCHAARDYRHSSRFIVSPRLVAAAAAHVLAIDDCGASSRLNAESILDMTAAIFLLKVIRPRTEHRLLSGPHEPPRSVSVRIALSSRSCKQ